MSSVEVHAALKQAKHKRMMEGQHDLLSMWYTARAGGARHAPMQPPTTVAKLDDDAEARLLSRVRGDERRRVKQGRVVSLLGGLGGGIRSG